MTTERFSSHQHSQYQVNAEAALLSLTQLSSQWLSKVHHLLQNLQVRKRRWRPRRSSPESLYSSSQIPRVARGTTILECEELVLPQPPNLFHISCSFWSSLCHLLYASKGQIRIFCIHVFKDETQTSLRPLAGLFLLSFPQCSILQDAHKRAHAHTSRYTQIHIHQ